MKFGKTAIGSPSDLRSFLGEGTEITGDIRFSEIMRVDAQVSGSIHSDHGSLVVMENGHVRADVEAGSVDVGGTIEGKVIARSSVKIRASGKVYGDIYTPALIIEYGAVFEGKCSMVNSAARENDVDSFARIDQKAPVEWSEATSLKIAEERAS